MELSSLSTAHRIQELPHSLLVRGLAMIGRVPFHERNTLPLDCMGYDDCRSIPHILRLVQCLYQLPEVEPVHLQDMPVERFPLVRQRFLRHYLLCEPILLYPVPVDYRCEIVELELCSRHRCLPDLSFVELTVAEQRVYATLPLVHLCSQGHSYCRGQSYS